MIAAIEANGTSANAYYVHSDHLGGSNAITDENGDMVQLLDYYPFGEIRLNEKTGKFDENRKYTGHIFDDKTELNYMGARYQQPSVGHFLSIDPVYNAIGDESLIESKTGMKLQQLLENPQALNSYSYSYNNPLIHRDWNGEFAFLAPIIVYAPVWVPVAITTISAIGAGVSSWFMGESVGYMMEGNYQTASQSLDNVQATLGATAIGVGGIMAADTALNGLSQTAQQGATRQGKISPVAQKISNGHAYQKHVVNQGQFQGIANDKQQFGIHVDNVMKNPTAARQLERGRTAYYHQNTNTVVIHDSASMDQGTALQPRQGVKYFNNLK